MQGARLMSGILELDKLLLFVLFVIPGFISLKVYELLNPAMRTDSSKQLIDVIAYSCLNYALLSPFIYWLCNVEKINPNLLYPSLVFMLFIAPLLWVALWQGIRRKHFIQKFIPHPTSQAWDFVFSKRKPYWIKVTLISGRQIAGLYSSQSFTSSSPHPQQIYMEETWILNKDGGFDRPKNQTAGVLILATDIECVELIDYI
tara:strand:+ start:1366 stop:1971 length:606 start_codon:yes stop_codon:yes gene_type:complete